MLKFIKQFLEEDTEVNKTLTQKEKTLKIEVAVCALLLEVAYSDDEFSDEERVKLSETIKNNFNLSDEEARELIEAAEKERQKSVDLWHFSDLINDKYSNEEKMELLELLWKIVYADNVLDKHEDYLMHQLSNLLRLDNRQLIAAKLKAMAGAELSTGDTVFTELNLLQKNVLVFSFY